MSEAEQPTGRLHYEASGARKTLLSIAFVVLLPFYISLPAMLIQRMMAGLWKDTVGLGLLALGFTAIMVILFLQLMFALRARVDIGDKAVALTLPAGQGPTPKFSYQKARIAFDEVLSVQTRAEVYGAPLAPVLLRGARIVTKNGDKVSLGFVNEHDVDTFPVLNIAQEIAQRAGIEVDDQGAVRRSMRAKALGRRHNPNVDTTLTQEERDVLNSQHRRVMVGFIGGLGILIAIGITMDFLSL